MEVARLERLLLVFTYAKLKGFVKSAAHILNSNTKLDWRLTGRYNAHMSSLRVLYEFQGGGVGGGMVCHVIVLDENRVA